MEKKRQPNFTADEIEALVCGVEKNNKITALQHLADFYIRSRCGVWKIGMQQCTNTLNCISRKPRHLKHLFIGQVLQLNIIVTHFLIPNNQGQQVPWSVIAVDRRCDIFHSPDGDTGNTANKSN